MPFREYQCSKEHITEKFFTGGISAGEDVKTMSCGVCGEDAKQIISAPLGFGLYGDPSSYGKPSATKRWSTKLVSRKEGNASSVG